MPYQKKEKNSLLLYYDYKEQFDELTDKQLRELIYAMIEYDQNDNEIELDSITKMAFIPIKRRLKKDKEYYTGKCNTNRENALKRWNTENATAYERKQTHAKYADKDKEKDKDKDIILKENIIKEKIQKKYFDNLELNNLFLDFLDLRKKLKCKDTERAINLLLNELNKYDDATKIEMLNNSIMNSWKSVYPIKEFKNNKKEDSFKKVLMEVYDGTIQFK